MELQLNAIAQPVLRTTTRRLSPSASAHLDLFRGTAAIVVALQHLRSLLLVDWRESTQHSVFAAATYFLAKFGHPAVIVFFVLSGFLIGSSGVRAIGNHTWSLGRFMVHRIVRLEVVLIPALCVGALCDRIGMHRAPALYAGAWKLFVFWSPIDRHLGTMLGNAAFLQGILVNIYGSNWPLWSLSNEFWYYVLFALLLTATLGTRRLRLRVLLLLLSAAVCWFVGYRIAVLALLWVFGLGVSLLPQLELSRRARRILLSASMIVFVGFTVVVFAGSRVPTVLERPAALDFVTGGLFSAVLYGVMHANTTGARYQQMAHLLARPTFTLYAFHMPLMALLLAWTGGRKDSTPLHCAEVLGWMVIFWCGSYLLYLLFESRTQNLRDWIEPRLFGRAQRFKAGADQLPIPTGR